MTRCPSSKISAHATEWGPALAKAGPAYPAPFPEKSYLGAPNIVGSKIHFLILLKGK